MITTQLVALDIIHGAGGTPVPPVPVPTPTGGGNGARKHRKYIKLRNGRQFEVDDEQDIRFIVEQIIEEREAEQPKKAKVSKKIRPRVKKPLPEQELTQFEGWDNVFAALQHIQMAVISEQILLDLIRKTVLAELEDEEDTEILLWLM